MRIAEVDQSRNDSTICPKSEAAGHKKTRPVIDRSQLRVPQIAKHRFHRTGGWIIEIYISSEIVFGEKSVVLGARPTLRSALHGLHADAIFFES